MTSMQHWLRYLFIKCLYQWHNSQCAYVANMTSRQHWLWYLFIKCLYQWHNSRCSNVAIITQCNIGYAIFLSNVYTNGTTFDVPCEKHRFNVTLVALSIILCLNYSVKSGIPHCHHKNLKMMTHCSVVEPQHDSRYLLKKSDITICQNQLKNI